MRALGGGYGNGRSCGRGRDGKQNKIEISEYEWLASASHH